jgi:hypothetical protein
MEEMKDNNGITDRNNVRHLDSKSPYMVTYLSEWAVQTELTVDNDAPYDPAIGDEVGVLAMKALLLGEDVSKRARELQAMIPRKAVSIVHKVGKGTIAETHSNGFDDKMLDHREYSLPGDEINGDHGLQALHARVVDMYYEKQNS